MAKPGYLPWDNPYIDAGWCADSMTVAVTATCADTGTASTTPHTKPVIVQFGFGVDNLRVGQFETSGATQWEHVSSLLHTHFTSADARDAFATAFAAAETDAERNAIIKSWKDITVGGNWGTVAVAP